jgi:hypothetical protein
MSVGGGVFPLSDVHGGRRLGLDLAGALLISPVLVVCLGLWLGGPRSLFELVVVTR